MKFIKKFEEKYLKKGQTLFDTKFKEDDYVSLTTDFENGYPSEGISKRVFKIKNIIGDNSQPNQYKLYYLNDKFFNWINENSLKIPDRKDIKKEIEKIKLENDMEKYNL